MSNREEDRTGPDPLMTVGDAARFLGLSPDMIRVLHREGRLAGLRTIRGQRLFRRTDVERLVQERAFALPHAGSPTERHRKRTTSRSRFARKPIETLGTGAGPAARTEPGRSILVVDDDLDVREALAETLEDRGFEVVTAENGLEALRLLQTQAVSPSVILLDLMMPVMDGYGFLDERRKIPALASIPVAIITAGHGVDHGRLGDASPVVSKPIKVPRLLGILRRLQSMGRMPT